MARLRDVLAHIRDEAVRAPAPAIGPSAFEGLSAAESVEAIAFDEIYRRAGLVEPPHGFTVYKLLEMTRDDDFKEVDSPTMAKVITGMLKHLPGGPVSMSVILRDASERNQALDAFEDYLAANARAVREGSEDENRRLQAEIDGLIERNKAQMAANDRRAGETEDCLEAWRRRREAEDRRLARAIAPFVPGAPTGEGDEGDQDAAVEEEEERPARKAAPARSPRETERMMRLRKFLSDAKKGTEVAEVGDFRLLSRRAIDALKQLPERTRFMKGLFAWIGFPCKEIVYRRNARRAGVSKWNYWRLWNLALEGITSLTVAPLTLATYVGGMILLAAIFSGLFVFGKAMFLGASLSGHSGLIVVLLFLGGLQLLAIGIIGEYLGRMFIESKQRPLYLLNRRYWLGAGQASLTPIRKEMP